MEAIFVKYSTIIGSFKRSVNFYNRIEGTSYYEKVRFANQVFGSDWIFRLYEVVGEETIRENRSTWSEFYVEDIYGAHLPLDPRAPETETYSGVTIGDKELALYCGAGFDGYSLALNTLRRVNVDNFELQLGCFRLNSISREAIIEEESLFDEDGNISAATYYRIYERAVESIFANCRRIVDESTSGSNDTIIDNNFILNTIFALLALLCGGHQGCNLHRTQEEANSSRLESIIIFLHASSLASMEFDVIDAELI